PAASFWDREVTIIPCPQAAGGAARAGAGMNRLRLVYRRHSRRTQMATHEDDRAAYLAGEDPQSLTADQRAELDELRSLLGSPAAWAEPSADLEDRLVTA